MPWAAVPALLTPLSATLVHAGLLHLGFNLLMLRVVRDRRSSGCLARPGLIVLYLVGAYAAALAQWARRSRRRSCR